MSEETNNSLVEGTSKASDVISAVNSILEGGGGGGGTPPSGATGIELVTTDAEEAAATDAYKVYFFSNGPQRGKGLYNTLLQEGSCVGKDGVTYTYSPRKLYHLYPDGSFDEVVPQEGDVTYQGNAVYYKGKRLPMPRYGELIYNHNVLYARTSDLATLIFRVSGPFYADSCNVTLHYNSSYIDVFEYVGAEGAGQEVLLNDGHVFEIDNSNFSNLHTLMIKRKKVDYDDGFDTFLNIAVRLSTPTKDVDVHVKFPKTQVFFKADPNVTTLEGINQHLPYGIAAWSSDIFSVDSSGRLVTKRVTGKQNVKEFTLDQRKRHKFYGLKFGNITSDKVSFEATWSNWMGYNTQSESGLYPEGDRIYWHSDNNVSNVYGDRSFVSCVMQELNHSFSTFKKSKTEILPVFADPELNTDEITVTLRIRVRNNSNGHAFDEIGVMEVDENCFDFTDEIKAVVPSNN